VTSSVPGPEDEPLDETTPPIDHLEEGESK
jgi:hypothetical protein